MTWTPRYLVQKAPGIGGPPIPEDEPCLVIRGQDILAPEILFDYIQKYEKEYGKDRTAPRARPVSVECLPHLAVLIEWQGDHPDKVKMADR